MYLALTDKRWNGVIPRVSAAFTKLEEAAEEGVEVGLCNLVVLCQGLKGLQEGIEAGVLDLALVLLEEGDGSIEEVLGRVGLAGFLPDREDPIAASGVLDGVEEEGDRDIRVLVVPQVHEDLKK